MTAVKLPDHYDPEIVRFCYMVEQHFGDVMDSPENWKEGIDLMVMTNINDFPRQVKRFYLDSESKEAIVGKCQQFAKHYGFNLLNEFTKPATYCKLCGCEH